MKNNIKTNIDAYVKNFLISYFQENNRASKLINAKSIDDANSIKTELVDYIINNVLDDALEVVNLNIKNHPLRDVKFNNCYNDSEKDNTYKLCFLSLYFIILYDRSKNIFSSQLVDKSKEYTAKYIVDKILYPTLLKM